MSQIRIASRADLHTLTHREALHMTQHFPKRNGAAWRGGERVTMARYYELMAALMDVVEYKQRVGATD